MSKNLGIIGIWWGDEGKGNIYSRLLEDAAERCPEPVDGRKPVLAYRWPGGPNAANSLDILGKKTIARQLSGGVLIPQKGFSQLGAQMYINPGMLTEEVQALQARFFEVSPANLGIAPNTHVILPYHIDADRKDFHTPGEHASTGRGIRPVSADKYGRVGIRFIEFLDSDLMAEILKEKRFPGYGDYTAFSEQFNPEREFLALFVKQDHVAVRDQGTHYKFAMGAHGAMLDINMGMYPGITSSHPADVPRWADTVMGVTKLYISSVGARDRHFPSRMEPELEYAVRKEWNEFGTGTGKPRQLGWVDLVMGRYVMESCGVDMLAGTMGDRLSVFSELGVKPQVVVGYEIDGQRYEEWQPSFHRRDTLDRVTPIVEEFEPWDYFLEADGMTMHPNAKRYVDFIEDGLGKPFVMQGNGPNGKTDIAVYKDPLDL
tara:strand:- start:7382 stop:8674 length:1293 start_codon:yes stop_codon:yes gene_type:complete